MTGANQVSIRAVSNLATQIRSLLGEAVGNGYLNLEVANTILDEAGIELLARTVTVEVRVRGTFDITGTLDDADIEQFLEGELGVIEVGMGRLPSGMESCDLVGTDVETVDIQ